MMTDLTDGSFRLTVGKEEESHHQQEVDNELN